MLKRTSTFSGWRFLKPPSLVADYSSTNFYYKFVVLSRNSFRNKISPAPFYHNSLTYPFLPMKIKRPTSRQSHQSHPHCTFYKHLYTNTKLAGKKVWVPKSVLVNYYYLGEHLMGTKFPIGYIGNRHAPRWNIYNWWQDPFKNGLEYFSKYGLAWSEVILHPTAYSYLAAPTLQGHGCQ